MSDVERPSGNGHSQPQPHRPPNQPRPPPRATWPISPASFSTGRARPPVALRAVLLPHKPRAEIRRRLAPIPRCTFPSPPNLPPPAPNDHTVLLALAHRPNEATAWRLLSAAAAGIAHDQATTVALLGFSQDSGGMQFTIDIHGAQSAEDLPVIGRMSAATDLQIARALFTLKNAVGIWLVAAPEPESHHFPAIAAIISDWLLACPTDNTGLLGTYHLLKRAQIKARRHAATAAFLVADDSARASGVHQRLRTAAQEFLKIDLRFAGVGPPTALPGVRMLTLPVTGPLDSAWAGILDELCPAMDSEAAEAPAPVPENTLGKLPEKSPEKTRDRPPEPRPVLHSPIARVIPPPHIESTTPVDIETAATDNLVDTAREVERTSVRAATMMLDHLAQVLDPEERDALTAAFDDLPESAEVAPKAAAAVTRPAAPVPTAPQAQPHPAPAKPTQKAESGVTLRAFDLLDSHERTRASQWQAVERSIRDLVPDSVLLEARPPMSWAIDSCIAIDPAGRLHIWTLYKDGTSWFALREWASEHRKLLGLTRRDSTICDQSPVVVHIVLPLEESPNPSAGVASGGGAAAASDANVVHTILRTPAKNIHIYRLRVLQWEGRRGLVVVPIA